MKFIERKKCAYCDPYDNQAHIGWRVEQIFIPFERFFGKIIFFLKEKFPYSYSVINELLMKGFFKILMISKILKEKDICEYDEKIHNRSLVIAQAARKRGIIMKALKLFGVKNTNFFSMVVNGKKLIFEGLPTSPVGHTQLLDFDNKFVFKKILRDNALPYAEGKVFSNSKTALRYAKELGFPLVVKPCSESLSMHTTCNLQNDSTLKEAILIAQIVNREFILEKHIPGDVYRITIVNNDFIACCLRKPPSVIGDGTHSIEELVNIKNNNSLRGNLHQKNFTLHKINLAERAISLMADRGLNVKRVPLKGERVYLHDKVVLACGSDIYDKTKTLHVNNRSMFLNLSRFLHVSLVGIDFICQDISKPYYEQSCAIIEANSLPYIDMHHFPIDGQPRDIAGFIIDSLLKI